MKGGADFSPDRIYRYRLWRMWGNDQLPMLIVIGLNPSTADETQDDPTIRRCIGFAKREGCGSLLMLNLFAYRSTDPRALSRLHLDGGDPVGPTNDDEILRCCAFPRVIVVAAWGAYGRLLWQDERVLKRLREHGVRVHCLGLTKTGIPRHPLYLRADAPLVEVPA